MSKPLAQSAEGSQQQEAPPPIGTIRSVWKWLVQQTPDPDEWLAILKDQWQAIPFHPEAVKARQEKSEVLQSLKACLVELLQKSVKTECDGDTVVVHVLSDRHTQAFEPHTVTINFTAHASDSSLYDVSFDISGPMGKKGVNLADFDVALQCAEGLTRPLTPSYCCQKNLMDHVTFCFTSSAKLDKLWGCPVCGAGKSSYVKGDADEKWQCKLCQHVYNPETDGGPNHLAFEDLPRTLQEEIEALSTWVNYFDALPALPRNGISFAKEDANLGDMPYELLFCITELLDEEARANLAATSKTNSLAVEGTRRSPQELARCRAHYAKVMAFKESAYAGVDMRQTILDLIALLAEPDASHILSHPHWRWLEGKDLYKKFAFLDSHLGWLNMTQFPWSGYGFSRIMRGLVPETNAANGIVNEFGTANVSDQLIAAFGQAVSTHFIFPVATWVDVNTGAEILKIFQANDDYNNHKDERVLRFFLLEDPVLRTRVITQLPYNYHTHETDEANLNFYDILEQINDNAAWTLAPNFYWHGPHDDVTDMSHRRHLIELVKFLIAMPVYGPLEANVYDRKLLLKASFADACLC